MGHVACPAACKHTYPSQMSALKRCRKSRPPGSTPLPRNRGVVRPWRKYRSQAQTLEFGYNRRSPGPERESAHSDQGYRLLALPVYWMGQKTLARVLAYCDSFKLKIAPSLTGMLYDRWEQWSKGSLRTGEPDFIRLRRRPRA